MKLNKSAIAAILALAAAALHGAEDPVSLKGVVTLMRPIDEYFFVRAEDGKDWRISMDGHKKLRLSPGDLVEANGLLEVARNRHTRRVFSAEVILTGHDESSIPEYAPTEIGELFAKPANGAIVPNWYARPVAIRGRVHDFWRRGDVTHIIAEKDGNLVQCQVSFPLGISLPEHFSIGASARIRGIALYSATWDVEHRLAGFDNICLLANGVESIEILSRPPFWTPVRIWTFCGISAATLLLLAGWIVLLKRTVARKSAQLFDAMKTANEAEAVQRERKRMAADLHDTIEQHLAGVKLLLTCALKAEKENERDKARDMIGRAAEMLIHAKGEIRHVVMNLRNDAVLDQSPAEAIRIMARRIESKGTVRARVCLNGLPDHLEATRHADLMMIVREAITNAIKHGKAKNIALVADESVLRVLNDGEPFDAKAALGPETGHFGLAGMQERAFRSRFRLSFGQEGKWVSVRIEVTK